MHGVKCPCTRRISKDLWPRPFDNAHNFGPDNKTAQQEYSTDSEQQCLLAVAFVVSTPLLCSCSKRSFLIVEKTSKTMKRSNSTPMIHELLQDLSTDGGGRSSRKKKGETSGGRDLISNGLRHTRNLSTSNASLPGDLASMSTRSWLSPHRGYSVSSNTSSSLLLSLALTLFFQNFNRHLSILCKLIVCVIIPL